MIKSALWRCGLILTAGLSWVALGGQTRPEVSMPNLQVCEGNQVRIPVYARHFQDVLGFQFAIRWPRGLQYDAIQDIHADISRYLSSVPEDSILNVFWLDESLKILNLKDSTVLFVLQLKKGSSIDIVGPLAFANEVSSPSVALSVAGEVLEDSIQTRDGSITFSSYPVYQKTADTIICKGSTLLIGIQSAGAEQLEYRWSTQDSSAQIAVQQPGVFRVRISNTYCKREDSIQIGAAPEVYLNLAKHRLFCPNEALLLHVKDTLQQNYRWSTGQLGANTLVPSFGRYWVQASNKAGCTQTDTIQVEPKAAAIALLKTKPSRCGQANGGLVFSMPIGATDLQLQVEGQAPVLGNVLENLKAGTLRIQAQYLGCDSIFQVMIPDSSSLQGVLEPIVSPATCGKKNGAINLAISGNQALQYRIHNREFGTEAQFNGLTPGTYAIEVKNEDGCTLRSQVEVKNIGALAISGVELSPALCQKSNGQIKLKLSGAIGAISYSLDSSFQAPLDQLVRLSAGDYQVYVRDSVCQQDTLLRINRDTMVHFSIQNIRVRPERCNGQDGKMVVETGGKTSGLTYLFGGLSFRNSTLEGLSKGAQMLIVQDSNGCQISRKVEIPSEAQSIQELAYSSTSNSCNQPEASLQLKVTKGGLPPFQFALQDSSQFQFSPNFEGLRPGKYQVWVKDQSRCPAQGLTVNIERKDCKVFVPNAFSPNQDQKNDFFRIMAPEGLVKMVRSFQVFDRWGALVYRATPNIDFANFDGWDGEVRESRAAQGPYLYTIELEYHDGFEKLPPVLRGTVQLMW